MTTATATAAPTFEVGRTYSTRLACSSTTILRFEVVKRTARFVTLRRENGDVVRVGVKLDDQGEWTLPLGTFSMAPVIRAGEPNR